jgi:hypothetical protein
MNRTSTYVPDIIDFLRKHFSFRFEFDNPEFTEITIKGSSIFAHDLYNALDEYRDAISMYLQLERKKSLEIYIGGPVNGKRCLLRRISFQIGEVIPVHVDRSKWAVYQIGEDNLRAWFKGFATSKKKAKNLQLVKEL